MSERRIETFVDCLVEAAGTPGFVKLFNELTGSHLTPESPPDSADARAFVAFVDIYAWQPTLAAVAQAEAG